MEKLWKWSKNEFLNFQNEEKSWRINSTVCGGNNDDVGVIFIIIVCGIFYVEIYRENFVK